MSIQNQTVEVSVRGLSSSLSYLLPDQILDPDIIYEVSVPLGKRVERGWITKYCGDEENSSETNKNFKLKKIYQAFGCFDKKSLELFSWMASYYGSTLAEAIESSIPNRHFKKVEYQYKLTKTHEEILKFIESLPKSAKNQSNLLKLYLEENQIAIPHSRLSVDSALLRAVKSLDKKGIIEKVPVSEEQYDNKTISHPSQLIDLNSEQRNAYEKISSELNQGFAPYLLYGVTGSGKTEVYLSLIKDVISQGKSALVVVPEIALTPQLTERFEKRLGTKIGLLHSKVGPGPRWETWQKALSGQIEVIVGARSAIFAPLRNIGLIIVDEEHESSYKQAEGLRYNGRDVAIMKAKVFNIPIILGSATPSFETLLNASKGIYKVHKLTERANKTTLPQIEVVDMKKYKSSELPTPNISPILLSSVEETLAKKEQIIIFYNKRGFASYLQCDSCNRTIDCPNCSVTLTYYQYKSTLNCHYCGLNIKAPEKCSICPDVIIADDKKKEDKIGKLSERGSGTERIHEELQKLFPSAAILRMDRDSTTKKDAVENIITAMHKGEADILVGTQMIAKGHDLPNVTLVGIIDADVGLHFPDFRASERTFQLIVQAAGRAGRGNIQGKVILQTRDPNHPTILAAVKNKFQAFAKHELSFRENLRYPPYGRLARIIISSPDNNETIESSQSLSSFLKHVKANSQTIEFNILGPTKAPLERIAGRYRWHLLVKSQSAKTLSLLAREVRNWKSKLKGARDTRVIFDIDPMDML